MASPFYPNPHHLCPIDEPSATNTRNRFNTLLACGVGLALSSCGRSDVDVPSDQDDTTSSAPQSETSSGLSHTNASNPSPDSTAGMGTTDAEGSSDSTGSETCQPGSLLGSVDVPGLCYGPRVLGVDDGVYVSCTEFGDKDKLPHRGVLHKFDIDGNLLCTAEYPEQSYFYDMDNREGGVQVVGIQHSMDDQIMIWPYYVDCELESDLPNGGSSRGIVETSSVSVDPVNESVYFAGHTESTSSYASHVRSLDANGGGLLWEFNGGVVERYNAVDHDSQGNVYAAGSYPDGPARPLFTSFDSEGALLWSENSTDLYGQYNAMALNDEGYLALAGRMREGGDQGRIAVEIWDTETQEMTDRYLYDPGSAKAIDFHGNKVDVVGQIITGKENSLTLWRQGFLVDEGILIPDNTWAEEGITQRLSEDVDRREGEDRLYHVYETDQSLGSIKRLEWYCPW